MNETRRRGTTGLTILGWTAILLFAAIYVVELWPHHGPPVTVSWLRETFGRGGLIAINIAIVIAFLALLPFRRPTRHVWKSRGAFVAFAIALMTEMFGWPLLLFVVAPLVDVPVLAPRLFRAVGHWPAVVGTALSLVGTALIAAGWWRIHRAEDLVDTGIYRFIRHPQYTGIFLFTLGWLLHWPSIVTLLLWPLLIAAYVWLARFEERQMIEEFGERYVAYAQATKRFVPFVV
ncbi:MAG: isoprenylcysteine carboxylmethyltransferase family protein [Acidobacteriota bacterium]|nr:MAG: isoprenylcysteine carboxylmethyltransferase family protein [Acidobacteriota bacterium]